MSAELIQSGNAVSNAVMNAVAFASEDVTVQSPPGAGKTTLLVNVTGLAVLRFGRTVLIACLSNDQANDVTRRLAQAFPGMTIDRFVKGGQRRPRPLVGLSNVNVVDKPQRLTARVTVATVAKYAEVETLNGERDFIFFDEAYQIRNADYRRVRDLARRALLIGDPGQIDPIAKTSIRHFAADPQGPHVAAPKAIIAANLARQFELPLSWRLPQDTVDLVRPAFYPDLSFGGVAEAGDRHIDALIAGSNPTDDLLDQAIAAGSLSMIALPTEVRPRVDPGVVGLVADLAGRLIERQFLVYDEDEGDHGRPITPNDIGVVAFYKDQVASLRAALGPGYGGIHVETANRFQGLERKVILSLHALAGKPRLDGFSAAGGRMCVAASRHRINCIIVGRDGVRDILNRFSPNDARYLGQVEDPYYDGWRAHSVLVSALEERNAVIRP